MPVVRAEAPRRGYTRGTRRRRSGRRAPPSGPLAAARADNGPMQIYRVEDASWLSNAYLVAGRAGGSAVVIDTGAPAEPIVEEARRLGVRVAWILNTHFHGDHVAGNAALVR